MLISTIFDFTISQVLHIINGIIYFLQQNNIITYQKLYISIFMSILGGYIVYNSPNLAIF